MQEDQQYERFDVDNDFEGGEFINGEFYYRNKRQKRQQTEDDRIYGIFASGSDSDEDGRRGRGGRGGGGGPADYSRPVAFVSKGVQNKPPQENQPKDQSADDDTGERRGGLGAPGLGLGAGSKAGASGGGAGGLGFTSGGGLGSARAGIGGVGVQGGDDDDESQVLPTAFGARIKARAEQRRKADEKQHKQEKQRKETATADPEFASFEKYTKGIGLKLLQKMGYKPGEGLGRDKSGIVKPVEAKLRAKNAGMGFGQRHYLEEKEEPAPVQGPKPVEAAAQGKLWKKRHTEVRVKREFKTAADVLDSSVGKPLAAQPILDMRGPQARLITNLEHLNAKDESATGQQVPMPELQHNLQLLVDLAESDIQKIDNRLRHEQDSVALLAREKTRLEEEVLDIDVQLKRMQLVLERVERCESAAAAQRPAGRQGRAQSPQESQPPQAPLTLSEIESVYEGLYKEFREEYVLYNLGAAALAHALPRMQALMSGWQPLQEPTRGAAEFRKWRALLDPQGASSSSSHSHQALSDPSQQDPYTQLFCEVVLPPLRAACTNWQPRDPEPLLRWLETWESLLPHVAMVHVLDMLVMPALRRAVTDWEPRVETVPIHAWLHPWLPYLGGALEELYPIIRGKLAAALSMWQAQDGSALVLLRPWHKVFSSEDWASLMSQCIVPKLGAALATFVVNPAAQDMTVFNQVMAWADVLPSQQMAGVLEQGFFPKWHQVLHYWLSHSPNYDEVTRWYLGWKSSFPPALLDQERIRRQFNAALDMMNSAVDGNVAAAGAAYQSRWAQPEPPPAAAAEPQPPLPHAAAGASHSSAEITLKDLVQRFAADNGIQFMPKFGRIQDGLQVYAFGNTSVTLDNVHSSIRALINNRWTPVTLETLVANNMKGKS